MKKILLFLLLPGAILAVIYYYIKNKKAVASGSPAAAAAILDGLVQGGNINVKNIPDEVINNAVNMPPDLEQHYNNEVNPPENYTKPQPILGAPGVFFNDDPGNEIWSPNGEANIKIDEYGNILNY